MSAHTPGPWKAIDRLDGRLQFNIRDADGLTVGGVDHREGVYSGYGAGKDANRRLPIGQPEAWANACLIAAAPDLLGIVQTIAKLIDEGVPVAMILDENSPTLDAIRDVLAKVKGEQA